MTYFTDILGVLAIQSPDKFYFPEHNEHIMLSHNNIIWILKNSWVHANTLRGHLYIFFLEVKTLKSNEIGCFFLSSLSITNANNEFVESPILSLLLWVGDLANAAVIWSFTKGNYQN